MRTSFYIDGFNLYNRAIIDTNYKWLNLLELCRGIVPTHEVTQIRYFTAIVEPRGDPQRPARQRLYLRALRTIPVLTIHLGKFMPRTKIRPLASNPTQFVAILDTEEKGTDVNIATYMMLDGYEGRYEQAVVISNDADLALPVSTIAANLPNLHKPVGVVNPNLDPLKVMPVDLVNAATFVRQLRESLLRRCLFPPDMSDSKGTFHKPPAW